MTRSPSARFPLMSIAGVVRKKSRAPISRLEARKDNTTQFLSPRPRSTPILPKWRQRSFPLRLFRLTRGIRRRQQIRDLEIETIESGTIRWSRHAMVELVANPET